MNLTIVRLGCCICLVAGELLAQSTGRMSGLITDSSGAAVPNAKVNLYLAGGGTPVASTVTTREGNYSFAGM